MLESSNWRRGLSNCLARGGTVSIRHSIRGVEVEATRLQVGPEVSPEVEQQLELQWSIDATGLSFQSPRVQQTTLEAGLRRLVRTLDP